MGVASIVLDDGGSEDEAIAALLHDAAEDHGGRDAPGRHPRAASATPSRRLSRTAPIRGTRRSLPGSSGSRPTFNTPGRCLGPSLRVSAADKVHNSYAILRDLRNSGEAVWERFSATPDDVMAYYESLVRAFREAGGGQLVDELDRIVTGHTT